MSRLLYHLSYAAIECMELPKYTNASISCQHRSLTRRNIDSTILTRMTHTTELTTRSYECDGYGHINNAVYLNYLEYARIQFLDALPVPYAELRSRGVGFVVTRVCIDYRRQVGSGQTLRIETRPVQKQRARMVFLQSVYRDAELVAEAQVTWACINERGVPIRIPPELDIPELEP